MPGLGGTQTLTRIVGTKIGMKTILAAGIISAVEASRLGIAILLPSANFEDNVNDFIKKIVNKPFDSIEAAKKAIKMTQSVHL